MICIRFFMLYGPLFTKLMKITIFEMVVNTSELAKEFVSLELLIFQKNQLDAKIQMPFGMVEET